MYCIVYLLGFFAILFYLTLTVRIHVVFLHMFMCLCCFYYPSECTNEDIVLCSSATMSVLDACA